MRKGGEGVEFFDFAPGILQDNFGPGGSTDYLKNYLSDLGATAVALEHHYVDRHYLDEFANYYSKSFTVPDPHCRRMHLFSRYSGTDLKALFHTATADAATTGPLEKLQEVYLGFIVRRPLPAARIGRTVLRTYPVEGRRHYEATRPYRVHLAGLSLNVDGLAFQHQDRGAAVCASTALWCALQRVAYMSGNRTPTPHAITQAAGSPYPASHGLTDTGMATALRKLGYIADFFTPAENREWFRTLLVASLESHLPVVLLLKKKQTTGAGEVDVGHAITLTGFSEPSTVVDVPCSLATVPPLQMRSGSLDVVYAHDDNLGPHAHYELLDVDDLDENGHRQLLLQRGDSRGARPRTWPVDRWQVLAALVPKPEKLRLSISSLLTNIAYFRPALNFAFGSLPLHYKGHFDTGVHVKEQLLKEDVEVDARKAVLFELSLPRHVGVMSTFHDTKRLCDVIIDVTEVDRNPGEPSLLTILAPGVPKASPAGIRFAAIAQRFQVPIVHRRRS